MNPQGILIASLLHPKTDDKQITTKGAAIVFICLRGGLLGVQSFVFASTLCHNLTHHLLRELSCS